MKKLAILLCLLSTTSIAATGTATSTAKIVPGLTITPIKDMDFGNIIPVPGNDTIWLYNDLIESMNGSTLFGNVSNPSFKVTGALNASIWVEGNANHLSNSAGDQLMLSGGFDGGYGGKMFKLDSDEGGLGSTIVDYNSITLYINPGQATGLYEGYYTVTVSYTNG